jgi:hypothetical protein
LKADPLIFGLAGTIVAPELPVSCADTNFVNLAGLGSSLFKGFPRSKRIEVE